MAGDDANELALGAGADDDEGPAVALAEQIGAQIFMDAFTIHFFPQSKLFESISLIGKSQGMGHLAKNVCTRDCKNYKVCFETFAQRFPKQEW